MEIALVMIALGLIVFLGHLFSAIFNRFRVPDVLFLIMIGLLLGPIAGLIQPSIFGLIGPVFTTITLILILFEGGLNIDFASLKKSIGSAGLLTISAFICTTLFVGIFVWIVTKIDFVLALMMGAILGSTSPVVILPLLKKISIATESQTMLAIECAISDVFSIVVALTLLQAYSLGDLRIELIIGEIFFSVGLAVLFGLISAIGWSILLNKLRLTHRAIFLTPAFVFVIYGMSELLGFSGYVACFVFGITIGNMDMFNYKRFKFLYKASISLGMTEKIFFSEALFIMKTFFFVYLGISIVLSDYFALLLGVFITIIIFMVRIVVVKISTIRNSLSSYDKSIISIMIPKGLAAAVVASIPLQQGLSSGAIIQNVSFSVILFSIIITSMFIFLMDKQWFFVKYKKIFPERKA